MIFLKNYFANTTQEIDVISITHDITYAIRDSSAKEGLATVFVPGAGGAVTILEMLPDLVEELKDALKMFPGEGRQTKTKLKEIVEMGPRIKSAMLGRTISLPFKEGKLLLASKEDIVLVDFDLKTKRREYTVQIMSDSGGGDEEGQGVPLGMMGG